MRLVDIPDALKVAVVERIAPVIQTRETANRRAALVDAGTRYGQIRQAGLPHDQAAAVVADLVHSWYGAGRPVPALPATPHIGDDEKIALAETAGRIPDTDPGGLFDLGCQFGQRVVAGQPAALAFHETGAWLVQWYGGENPWPAPPAPPLPRRHGVVRLEGRAFVDAGGSYLAIGASLFWACQGFREDRAQLDANLAWLAEHGVHYIRVLGVVGGGDLDPDPWAIRGTRLDWPDYDRVIAGLTDHAYDTYGLRVQWTLFGGVAQAARPWDQERIVERFAAMARGREHKIQHFEIANEAWQNGFAGAAGAAQLRHLARGLRSRLRPAVPIALTAPFGLANDAPGPEQLAEVRELYGGDSAADLWTPHFSRHPGDDRWRHVRQPWEVDAFPDAPHASTNNEPVGPGASVTAEEDPTRVVAAAVSSFICGQAGYVFHTDAGVWGGKLHPHYAHTGQGRHANLFDHPTAPAIAAGLRNLQAVLPADLPNWTRTRHGRPDHPFAPSFTCGAGRCLQIWPDGEPAGVVRIFAAHRYGAFVAHPIGVRGRVVCIPSGAMDVTVHHPLTFEPLQQRTLAAHEALELDDTFPAYVLAGRYR